MGKNRFVCIVYLIILTLGASSCAHAAESNPNAWIDYPGDGAVLNIGEVVGVMSHAFASEGVAEVVLSVNGEAYRRDVPAEIGNDFVSIQQDWLPAEAGLYTLQVQAYDRRGNPGNPAIISVEVRGDVVASPIPVASVTLVPSATEVNTATPVVTVTAVASATPVITVTSPPPAPATQPPPPPGDTSPPPAPVPVVPAAGLELTCRATQTLAWLPVNDPSGVSGYYVKLEKEVTAGNWSSAGGYGPLSGKQVQVNVDCGVRYRWMVRARDGAGNYSDWSAPSTFSVTMN